MIIINCISFISTSNALNFNMTITDILINRNYASYAKPQTHLSKVANAKYYSVVGRA